MKQQQRVAAAMPSWSSPDPVTYELQVFVSDGVSMRLLFVEKVRFVLRPGFKVTGHEFFGSDGGRLARQPAGVLSDEAWEAGIKNWLFRRSPNPFMVSRDDEDDGSKLIAGVAKRLQVSVGAGADDEGVVLVAEYPSPWSLVPSSLCDEDKGAAKYMFVLEEL